MREISFSVADYPPAKNEAKSMLAAGHVHASRVLALLGAARVAIGDAPQPLFPSDALGLEVVLESPTEPPSDATNYLGGIADALEAKGRRGNLEHLGDLAFVALCANDRQIQGGALPMVARSRKALQRASLGAVAIVSGTWVQRPHLPPSMRASGSAARAAA